MQASIVARGLNKEQFPLNLLLCSNISLCLYLNSVSHRTVFNLLPYRPRAHTGVLPCKHFWLPTSAMLHCSCRAVTRVLFLENMGKEQRTSQMPCTLHPLYILSGELRHLKELSEKMFLRFSKGAGRLRHQIRIRLGSVHSRQSKFH